MTRKIRSMCREDRGSVSVEVALLLPVFLLLFFASVDFGRLCWTKGIVNGAAAEGARMAVLTEPTDGEVAALVVQKLANGGVTEPASVNVGVRTAGEPVDVTVAVPFEFKTLGTFVPSLAEARMISATSVMVHER